MKRPRAALLAVLFTAAAPTALSQQATGLTVTMEEAVAIARDAGLVRIIEAERDDGRWEIEGCDREGREVEIEIDGETGEILKTDIDTDPEHDCR